MLFVLTAMFAVAPIVLSEPHLEITVNISKHNYHYRQLVNIYGNVTYGDQLVEDGLVALQLGFYYSSIRHNATRTVPANATPTENWTIEINSFITTDSNGDPQTAFKKGGNAWFKYNVTNNDVFESQTILIVVSLYDVDATPFKTHWIRTTVTAGTTFGEMFRIDLNGYDGGNWISTGSAVAYANVYTDWPAQGGYPYCPEKAASFTILPQSGLATNLPSYAAPAGESSYNSYHASVRLPPNIPLGTYNITVSAYYRGFKNAFTTCDYDREYEMRGDIIYNRKIDIFDIVAVAAAYGKTGGQPGWNPEADLDANGKVDIFDIVIVAGSYGKVY